MKKKILEATLPLLNIFRIDLLSDKRCLNAFLYPLQKNRRPLFMKRQADKIVQYAFFLLLLPPRISYNIVQQRNNLRPSPL